MSKIVKDPVHGYISLSDRDLKLIDTFVFQRLRRVRHVPAEVVYPGATHSRFEHSLGVMTLSDFIFEVLKEERKLSQNILKEEKKYRNTLRYAALLHDLGHTPLSHVCERFGEDATALSSLLQGHIGVSLKPRGVGPSHEWTSCVMALLTADIVTELKRNRVDLELFCRMVCGIRFERDNKELNPLIDVINSHIDADKLDYILRDNFMTGATFTSLDRDRIIRSYTVEDDSLALSKRALSAISQLIYGRDALYLWLYTHHLVAYCHDLIQRYLEHLGRAKLVNLKKFFSWESLRAGTDDHELYHLLYRHRDNDDYTRLLYRQIFARQFYKALWKDPFECIFAHGFGDVQVERLCLNPRRLEEEIIKGLSLPNLSVFVYLASFTPFIGYLSNVRLGIGEKTYYYFERVFHEQVHQVPAKIIAKIPYIRISREILSRKPQIIEWLRYYRPT